MSGVDPSDTGLSTLERQHKRARSGDELVVDEESSPEHMHGLQQQRQQWPVPSTEAASKQPAKIKLSLKLGALKLQQTPVAPVAARRFERTELDTGTAYGDEAEERRRQPSSLYMTPTSASQTWLHESASLPALSSTADQASGTHTPRIKLRFSFKGAATPDMLMTPVSATPTGGPRRSVWGSVRAGSPSESVGSYDSAASDMDTDDSGGDGRTYDHASHYSSAATTPRTPGGTGRPRGRPPLRGRRSSSQSARPQTGTPGFPRKPANALTTSVSLKSSLLRLVKRIRKRDSYGFFLEPVDTAIITDYLGVIKTPMDLGTMQRKVETNKYRSIAEFRQDMLLICQNARKYNGEGSIYARSADRIQEYAIVAIDRETAKLESVGRASLAPEDLANDSDSAFGATPQPQSYAQSPEHSRSASPCPSRDDHSDGDYRRTTRRKWRATSTSEPNHSAGAGAGAATPASIVDIFKWSAAGAGKKKGKRTSTVPRKINDLQMKVPLLADGSLDPTGFEEDIAMAAYDHPAVDLPLIAGPRSSNSVGAIRTPTGDGFPAPVYAYGRHYLPAAYADYGPRQHPQAAAEAAANIGKLVPNLQTIHGDSLGLAYWHSISDFIDGAGDEASTYATMVMDHLTNGAHTSARDTLSYLADRDAHQALEPPGSMPKKGGLSTSTLRDIVDWLERRPVRDRLFSQRLEALTRPMYLREVSPRCAAAKSRLTAVERPAVTDAGKHRLFEKTNRSLKRIHDQIRNPSAALPSVSPRELEDIEDDIYTLAEQMCLSLTGSNQPTARLPALTRVPAPSNSRPLATRAPAPPALNNRPMPPRPNRTMSTPVLPALNSASLAAAVCSDMMRGIVDATEADYSYSH
ncbi:hypothetical protein GGI19_001954 [Coemansia pectinata]|uniref:Bromo domain-containing protein n=1 Tax=Coemansia pectinata TaxID=1052879 RepID=A0A9W8H0K0_9FUNG|nr:hypothetical protein GGI19_001954 [Coemansia pectinata]